MHLDYHEALASAHGGMDGRLPADGMLPTPAGYAVMAVLAEWAAAQALGMGKKTETARP